MKNTNATGKRNRFTRGTVRSDSKEFMNDSYNLSKGTRTVLAITIAEAARKYMKTFATDDSVLVAIKHPRKMKAAKRKGIVVFASNRIIVVNCNKYNISINLGDLIQGIKKIKKII